MLPKSKVLEIMLTWEQVYHADCIWVVHSFASVTFLSMLYITSSLWHLNNIWVVLPPLTLIGWQNSDRCFLVSKDNIQEIKVEHNYKNKVKTWWLNNFNRRKEKRNNKRIGKKISKQLIEKKEKTKVVLLCKLANCQGLANFQSKINNKLQLKMQVRKIIVSKFKKWMICDIS